MTYADALLRVKHLEDALKGIAASGTLHDPMPTRAIPIGNEQAMKVDAWWANYHMSAEMQVRKIAKDALA